MVQYTSFFREDSQNPNCVTGDEDHLYDRLKISITRAKKIEIIVAFLMESGVRLLIDDLKEAVDRGTDIRILCGNYLNITQPQALYLLKGELGDRIDLRFYNVPNRSFHPKAYIFEYEDGGDIYVGSSNISHSALTNGIEWNYRIRSSASPDDYSHFKNTFENLFLNHSIIVDDNEMRRYSQSWKRPRVFEDIERLEDGTNEETGKERSKAAEVLKGYISDEDNGNCKIIQFPQPMGPQIEALYELNKSRNEDFDKGVVVAATGVGKTFLAAFDSKCFDRILFVAHREEILLQAERTFRCVRPDSSTGFFSGDRKDMDCDILFATVQTIGRQEYLNESSFRKDEFDYIVIDEFHHAAAESYKNIIEYFTPKFLLGLTATPERLDGKDVFALCDYNLIYEARLKEAINKGWLVPFRYYGIFDDIIKYSEIDYRNGRYDEKQLERALSVNNRADLILRHYQKYVSKRALGFCSSRGHASYMAEYFSTHGVKACAVISGSPSDWERDLGKDRAAYIMERKEAIEKLKKAEINVIFSVDMFNEGLDVPEVDMVMFLRPTESPTVFLQQLGRGLRKKGGKKYVSVLDFIGNYKNVILIPFLLSGNIEGLDRVKAKSGYQLPEEDEYPEGCIINFDLRVVDIFRRMAEEKKDIFDKISDEYFRIKERIVERPLRLQMYINMDESIYNTIRSRAELNIFRDYISFLDRIGESTEEQRGIKGTIAHDFLVEIERTSMTKTYKMPVLLAFYNNGNMKLAVDEDDIYKSFREFYLRGSNAVDLLRDKSSKNFRGWGKKEYINLAKKNPMHFLMQTSPEFFHMEGDKFCLNDELEKFINNSVFVRHFKDIIDYRTKRFYRERLKEKQAEFEKSLADGKERRK